MGLIEIAATGAGIAGAAVGGFAYAANWPTSQLFGRTVVASTDPNQIALTFDDGPNPAVTPWLLEALARRNITATFFLIGRYVQAQPALVREIAAAGHSLGCHTMTHPRLTLLPLQRIRAEIADSQRAVQDASGMSVRLFRPPHGARRPAVMRVARELGMSTVMWNCIVGDWNPIPAQMLADGVIAKVRNNQRAGRGTNVVLHDGGHLHLNAPRMESVKAVDILTQRLAGMKWIAIGQGI